MKVALITAGGAGMFCGSCMQDNTLVRALRIAGHDAVLVPTYTPIRVDEDNASVDQVFLGGINVYLDSKIPGFHRLPRWTKSWLDRPGIIRALTRFGVSTEASGLGALTLDMLKGAAGPQREEYQLFVDFLCNDLRPDIILFSNALLSGLLDELRDRFTGRIECLLQGDDVFLEELTPKWKPQIMQQLSDNCSQFDGFLTHSAYYSDFMSAYLGIDRQRIRQIPLTIDVDVAQPANTQPANTQPASTQPANGEPPEPETGGRVRIGYFARICPEKGIQQFLQAAERVLSERQDVEFVVAGFLPKQHERWFSELYQRAIRRFPDHVFWLGSPADRETKFRYIQDFDHLCVPTQYREPKGLYVLEAAVAGVPAIVPDHGAFPELIGDLKFGTLFDHSQDQSLAKALIAAAERGPRVRTTDEGNSELRATLIQNHGMENTGRIVGDLLSPF